MLQPMMLARTDQDSWTIIPMWQQLQIYACRIFFFCNRNFIFPLKIDAFPSSAPGHLFSLFPINSNRTFSYTHTHCKNHYTYSFLANTAKLWVIFFPFPFVCDNLCAISPLFFFFFLVLHSCLQDSTRGDSHRNLLSWVHYSSCLSSWVVELLKFLLICFDKN